MQAMLCGLGTVLPRLLPHPSMCAELDALLDTLTSAPVDALPQPDDPCGLVQRNSGEANMERGRAHSSASAGACAYLSLCAHPLSVIIARRFCFVLPASHAADSQMAPVARCSNTLVKVLQSKVRHPTCTRIRLQVKKLTRISWTGMCRQRRCRGALAVAPACRRHEQEHDRKLRC